MNSRHSIDVLLALIDPSFQTIVAWDDCKLVLEKVYKEQTCIYTRIWLSNTSYAFVLFDLFSINPTLNYWCVRRRLHLQPTGYTGLLDSFFLRGMILTWITIYFIAMPVFLFLKNGYLTSCKFICRIKMWNMTFLTTLWRHLYENFISKCYNNI